MTVNSSRISFVKVKCFPKFFDFEYCSSSFEILNDSTLKKHALEPLMYAGNTPSSSYENVFLR